MARKHPTVPGNSSSQMRAQLFDGESGKEDVNQNKQNKNSALSKIQSSTRDMSRIFVKEVNGLEEPIEFCIIGDHVEWDDLSKRIIRCGGKLVDERPKVGYSLVDPRTKEGVLEISVHSTQKRRAVSFRFVDESIKRGRIIPILELGLFIKADRPVKFHIHKSLPRDEIDCLKDDILLRGGNPDAELSKAQVMILSRDFRDTSILRRRWPQILLFGTSDWLKSCITTLQFSLTEAGDCLGVLRKSRPIPTSGAGRKPRSPRTEFTEQDDICLVAWMAYQFGEKQIGRLGNLAYKRLVQDEDQLWWTKRHTWQSWRERYKTRSAHFDPLIFQTINEREQSKTPKQLGRQQRVPKFPESEEDNRDEQEDEAKEPESSTARARSRRGKRKAHDTSDTMVETSKQIATGAKRIKSGTQIEDIPAIRTLASGDDQQWEDYQFSNENGILDKAVAANDMPLEDGEDYTTDDPDVDVVGVTQVETLPSPNVDGPYSEVDDCGTESTGDSDQDDEVGEAGEAGRDTIKERLSTLANAFGAMYARAKAYYSCAVEKGLDQDAAYEFTENQLQYTSRQD
ncbi:hypothetical protein RSAG8_09581, partial [Rhizoctonia solani AG-8 WAC10335]